MKIPPGVQKAIEYILNKIASDFIKPGATLSGIPQLAREAGVAPVTMWKALGILRSKRIIEGMQGNPLLPAFTYIRSF